MEVIVVDVETTGLHPERGDEIVEVAAVRFRNGAAYSEFSTLVNPNRSISPGASRVNGLTDEMLTNAPTIKEVFPALVKFIDRSTLVAHNAPFDLGFLSCAARKVGVGLRENPVLCTLQLSRRLLPARRSYSLASLVEELGIRAPVQHRALGDVHATWAVLERLLGLRQRGSRITIEQLLVMQGGPIPWPDFSPQDLPYDLPASFRSAIDTGGTVTFTYLAADGQRTRRTVQPLSAYRENGATYLVAFCHLRNEERTFRLDRIT